MIKPFLKWPGGKRWLLPYLVRFLQERSFQRYFEPFLGGGAIFFGLQPRSAVLSDINEDLINTYRQVRDHAPLLIERLQMLPVEQQTYLALRKTISQDPFERAVRFLYLNRTAFGGIYRLDRNGHFNVPFGGGERTPAPLWKGHLLANAAPLLQQTELIVADFAEILAQTGEGDLVYCDPTYTVAHNNNGFIRYNERNFSWTDQQRLARMCQEAAQRGATIFISNAFHHEVAALYSDAQAYVLERKSLVSPVPAKRQTIQEYLFFLKP